LTLTLLCPIDEEVFDVPPEQKIESPPDEALDAWAADAVEDGCQIPAAFQGHAHAAAEDAVFVSREGEFVLREGGFEFVRSAGL